MNTFFLNIRDLISPPKAEPDLEPGVVEKDQIEVEDGEPKFLLEESAKNYKAIVRVTIAQLKAEYERGELEAQGLEAPDTNSVRAEINKREAENLRKQAATFRRQHDEIVAEKGEAFQEVVRRIRSREFLKIANDGKLVHRSISCVSGHSTQTWKERRITYLPEADRHFLVEITREAIMRVKSWSGYSPEYTITGRFTPPVITSATDALESFMTDELRAIA
jgi:hypothetical protein